MTTDVKDGAGLHAEWEYGASNTDASFSTTLTELSTLKWKIQVYDHNDARKHAFIGDGEAMIPAKDVQVAIAGAFTVKVPLLDDKHKPVGAVTLEVSLKSASSSSQQRKVDNKVEGSVAVSESNKPNAVSKAPAAAAPASSLAPAVALSSDPVTLQISRIVADVTKNVELMMYDKNDLYVIIETSNSWKMTTDVKDGAGLHAEWEYGASNTDASFSTTLTELSTLKWKIQVYDHNDILKHTFIGDGEATMLTVNIQAAMTGVTVLKVPLLDKKHKPVGEVALTVSLKSVSRNVVVEVPCTVSEPLSNESVSMGKMAPKAESKPFTVGILHLSKISLELKTSRQKLSMKLALLQHLSIWRRILMLIKIFSNLMLSR
jgi:hypothetical protein